MKIDRNKNIAILTDNNTQVLNLFSGIRVIDDVNDLKNIDEKFIVLNDVLRNLKLKDLHKLLSIFKEKNIHYVNITSKVEEVVYADYLIIYNKNRLIIEGTVTSVLKEEKLLKRLGYALPFAFDLSLQLNYYNLLQSFYLDEKSLGDKLW